MEATDRIGDRQKPLRLKIPYLVKRLGFTEQRLQELYNSVPAFVKRLHVTEVNKRPRKVVSVRGDLRLFQKRLLERVLSPHLVVSDFSHGSVRGRHILTNITPHLSSSFAWSTDIRDFFPHISHQRVYRFFSEDLKCDPDASRLCTRLTTFDGHLALGMVTSPCLANAILQKLDARIGNAVRSRGHVYTRFVDDIIISGRDIIEQHDPIVSVVNEIMNEAGFQLAKDQWGAFADGLTITKIVIREGKPDVSDAFLHDFSKDIRNVRGIASGHRTGRPFQPETRLEGRARFAGWINPERGAGLLAQVEAVDWSEVHYNARRFGIPMHPGSAVEVCE